MLNYSEEYNKNTSEEEEYINITINNENILNECGK